MIKKTSDKSDLLKLYAATIIAVLVMHVGIAAALVHMQGPKPVVEKPEEVKPIEIQMLSMQEAVEPPSAVQSEQNMPQATQEQVAKVQSQNKPASKPEEPEKPETKPVKQNKTEPEVSEPQTKSEPQVEPVEETQLVNKSDPEPQRQTEPETDLETDSKLETDLEIVTKIKKTPIIDDNEHQRLIEQAAREQAAREQAAREQAAREQAAREQAAREQAAREQAAQEKAAQEKAAQEKAAANNTPRSFSESQARWKRKPKLILPQQVDRRARLGEIFSLSLEVIVDKQGNVTKVTVTKSSGNQIVDNATVTEVKRSKLHPFTEDNLPVVGKIILPVEYVKK